MCDQQEQLAWRAACYLLGELSPEDAGAFEAELATNQPAREALASAVELQQAALAALSPVLVQPVSLGRPATAGGRAVAARFVWGGAVALAAGALVTCLANWSARFGPAVDGELAAVWSEVRSSAPDALVEPVAIDLAGATELSGSVLSGEVRPSSTAVAMAETDEADFDEAPSWMTAAVLGIAGNQPEQPERMEN